MNLEIDNVIKRLTGAAMVKAGTEIQSLWSGYGSIVRYGLEGVERASVVVKHVRLSQVKKHPRGWNTDLSHQRKLKSYEVESTWYEQWAIQCGEDCRVPKCLGIERLGEDVVIVLEDLDTAGFSERREAVSLAEIELCLRWLAHFHATFLGKAPMGLWDTGTYWHLATRPDELEALTDLPLKRAASALDRMLTECRFQTFVHGDAKLANFCFADSRTGVAAVDFQYVGSGCGMKDVAYFIGSCLQEAECERQESVLLDTYFAALEKALGRYNPKIAISAIESEWRALYPVAWTDFHRFLKGWSPGHWKIHGYSERLARQVLSSIKDKE